MSKIKNLEFLRVVGCLAILTLHFCSTAGFGAYKSSEVFRQLMSMTSSGQKAVDLFFILSGFFFALKLDVSQSLWSFIKKKLVRLYPPFIFTTLLFMVASWFCSLKFNVYQNVLDILGISGTPMGLGYGSVGLFWYVSTLLWVSAFFFYLRKYFSRHSTNLIIALLAFFSYAFIIQARNGSIANPAAIYGYVFSVAAMRGLGGIGIGYFIGEWYKFYQEKSTAPAIKLPGRLALTVLEGLCIFFIIYYLILHRPDFKNHLLYIVVFTVTIFLFLLKQGWFSRLLDHDIWGKLSVYTYSIYIVHVFVLRLLKATVWQKNTPWVLAHPLSALGITLIAAIALGVITFHLVEKPAAKYLSRKFLRGDR